VEDSCTTDFVCITIKKVSDVVDPQLVTKCSQPTQRTCGYPRESGRGHWNI